MDCCIDYVFMHEYLANKAKYNYQKLDDITAMGVEFNKNGLKLDEIKKKEIIEILLKNNINFNEQNINYLKCENNHLKQLPLLDDKTLDFLIQGNHILLLEQIQVSPGINIEQQSKVQNESEKPENDRLEQMQEQTENAKSNESAHGRPDNNYLKNRQKEISQTNAFQNKNNQNEISQIQNYSFQGNVQKKTYSASSRMFNSLTTSANEEGSVQTRSFKKNYQCDMVILFSFPLVYAQPPHESIDDLIDFQKEAKVLKTSIVKLKQKNLTLSVQNATYKNLLKKLLKEWKCDQSKILHIYCHGMKEILSNNFSLFFEDECYFKSHSILDSNIKQEISNPPDLVFLSACHSEQFARIFLDMGVKCAIAVSSTQELSNKVAINFSELFYQKIFQPGQFSIKKAFNQTLDNVKKALLNDGKYQQSNWFCCCMHPHNEGCKKRAEYFKLKKQICYQHRVDTKSICICYNKIKTSSIDPNIVKDYLFHFHNCDAATKFFLSTEIYNLYQNCPDPEIQKEHAQIKNMHEQTKQIGIKQEQMVTVCCCAGFVEECKDGQRKYVEHNQTSKMQIYYKDNNEAYGDIILFDDDKQNQFFGEQNLGVQDINNYIFPEKYSKQHTIGRGNEMFQLGVLINKSSNALIYVEGQEKIGKLATAIQTLCYLQSRAGDENKFEFKICKFYEKNKSFIDNQDDYDRLLQAFNNWVQIVQNKQKEIKCKMVIVIKDCGKLIANYQKLANDVGIKIKQVADKHSDASKHNQIQFVLLTSPQCYFVNMKPDPANHITQLKIEQLKIEQVIKVLIYNIDDYPRFLIRNKFTNLSSDDVNFKLENFSIFNKDNFYRSPYKVNQIAQLINQYPEMTLDQIQELYYQNINKNELSEKEWQFIQNLIAIDVQGQQNINHKQTPGLPYNSRLSILRLFFILDFFESGLSVIDLKLIDKISLTEVQCQDADQLEVSIDILIHILKFPDCKSSVCPHKYAIEDLTTLKNSFIISEKKTQLNLIKQKNEGMQTLKLNPTLRKYLEHLLTQQLHKEMLSKLHSQALLITLEYRWMICRLLVNRAIKDGIYQARVFELSEIRSDLLWDSNKGEESKIVKELDIQKFINFHAVNLSQIFQPAFEKIIKNAEYLGEKGKMSIIIKLDQMSTFLPTLFKIFPNLEEQAKQIISQRLKHSQIESLFKQKLNLIMLEIRIRELFNAIKSEQIQNENCYIYKKFLENFDSVFNNQSLNIQDNDIQIRLKMYISKYIQYKLDLLKIMKNQKIQEISKKIEDLVRAQNIKNLYCQIIDIPNQLLNHQYRIIEICHEMLKGPVKNQWQLENFSYLTTFFDNQTKQIQAQNVRLKVKSFLIAFKIFLQPDSEIEAKQIKREWISNIKQYMQKYELFATKRKRISDILTNVTIKMNVMNQNIFLFLHANPLLKDSAVNNNIIINSHWEENIKSLADQKKYPSSNLKKELYIDFQNLSFEKLVKALTEKPLQLLVLKFEFFENQNEEAYFFHDEFWLKKDGQNQQIADSLTISQIQQWEQLPETNKVKEISFVIVQSIKGKSLAEELKKYADRFGNIIYFHFDIPIRIQSIEKAQLEYDYLTKESMPFLYQNLFKTAMDKFTLKFTQCVIMGRSFGMSFEIAREIFCSYLNKYFIDYDVKEGRFMVDNPAFGPQMMFGGIDKDQHQEDQDQEQQKIQDIKDLDINKDNIHSMDRVIALEKGQILYREPAYNNIIQIFKKQKNIIPKCPIFFVNPNLVMRQIIDCIFNPKYNVLNIFGKMHNGKTSLVLQLAKYLTMHCNRNVYYFDIIQTLSSVKGAKLDNLLIKKIFDEHFSKGGGFNLKSTGNECIIILNNFDKLIEHKINNPKILQDLLCEPMNGKLIIVTREKQTNVFDIGNQIIPESLNLNQLTIQQKMQSQISNGNQFQIELSQWSLLQVKCFLETQIHTEFVKLSIQLKEEYTKNKRIDHFYTHMLCRQTKYIAVMEVSMYEYLNIKRIANKTNNLGEAGNIFGEHVYQKPIEVKDYQKTFTEKLFQDNYDKVKSRLKLSDKKYQKRSQRYFHLKPIVPCLSSPLVKGIEIMAIIQEQKDQEDNENSQNVDSQNKICQKLEYFQTEQVIQSRDQHKAYSSIEIQNYAQRKLQQQQQKGKDKSDSLSHASQQQRQISVQTDLFQKEDNKMNQKEDTS